MHVDTDSYVGCMSIDLCLLHHFNEFSKGISYVSKSQLVLVLLGEGVKPDPDWSPSEILLVWVEAFDQVA